MSYRHAASSLAASCHVATIKSLGYVGGKCRGFLVLLPACTRSSPCPDDVPSAPPLRAPAEVLHEKLWSS